MVIQSELLAFEFIIAAAFPISYMADSLNEVEMVTDNF